MFKIAIRNLFRNKLKSLITVALIAISSVVILLIGSLLGGGKKYFEQDARLFYTGDIVITGNTKSKNSSSTILGVEQTISIGGVNLRSPLVDDIKKTEEKLKSIPDIEAFTKSVLYWALLRPPYDKDYPYSWTPEPEKVMYTPYNTAITFDKNYFNVFPSVKLIEGKVLNPEEENTCCISALMKEYFECYYGKELNIGDKIVFAYGDRFKIVSIAGIYKPLQEDSIFGTKHIFADNFSVKYISRLTQSANLAVELPKELDVNLFSDNDDEIFSDSDSGASDEDITSLSSKTQKKEDDYTNILGDTSVRTRLNLPDPDAWHFVHIRLKDKKNETQLIAELNKWFKENGLNNRAINYEEASGRLSNKINTANFVFKCLTLFFSVIVFIVICNTLVVSVLERKKEIGTMRALGGDHNFVKNMFFAESVCLASIGSLLGIFITIIAAIILNVFKINLGGLSSYIGRMYAYFYISPYYAALIFVFMNIACLIATLYPVSLAVKILPVTAMKNER